MNLILKYKLKKGTFLYLENEGAKILLSTLWILSLRTSLVFKELDRFSKFYFFSAWNNCYFMDNFCYLHSRL